MLVEWIMTDGEARNTNVSGFMTAEELEEFWEKKDQEAAEEVPVNLGDAQEREASTQKRAVVDDTGREPTQAKVATQALKQARENRTV